jgi:hypothetical protein
VTVKGADPGDRLARLFISHFRAHWRPHHGHLSRAVDGVPPLSTAAALRMVNVTSPQTSCRRAEYFDGLAVSTSPAALLKALRAAPAAPRMGSPEVPCPLRRRGAGGVYCGVGATRWSCQLSPVSSHGNSFAIIPRFPTVFGAQSSTAVSSAGASWAPLALLALLLGSVREATGSCKRQGGGAPLLPTLRPSSSVRFMLALILGLVLLPVALGACPAGVGLTRCTCPETNGVVTQVQCRSAGLIAVPTAIPVTITIL